MDIWIPINSLFFNMFSNIFRGKAIREKTKKLGGALGCGVEEVLLKLSNVKNLMMIEKP